MLVICSSITVWRNFNNFRVCQIPFYKRQWEVFLPWTEMELFRSNWFQNRIKICVQILTELELLWSNMDEFLLSNCVCTSLFQTCAIPVKNSSTNAYYVKYILLKTSQQKCCNHIARSVGSFQKILFKILVLLWKNTLTDAQLSSVLWQQTSKWCPSDEFATSIIIMIVILAAALPCLRQFIVIHQPNLFPWRR